MKYKISILVLLAISFPISRLFASDKIPYQNDTAPIDSVKNRLNINNISAFFGISGTFDQDLRTSLSSGVSNGQTAPVNLLSYPQD